MSLYKHALRPFVTYRVIDAVKRLFLCLLAFVCFCGIVNEAKAIGKSPDADSLLKFAIDCKVDTTKSLLLGEASYQFRSRSQDTSMMLARQGFGLANELGYAKGKAINLRCIAIQLFNRGYIDSSYLAFQQAEEFAKEANWDKDRAISLNYLAEILKLKGMYTRSAENYFLSLRIRESLKDTAGICSALSGLSEVFYLQKSYEEAEQYLKRAEALIPYLESPRTAIQIYQNLAKVSLTKKGNYTAEKYARLSLFLAQRHKLSTQESFAYNLLGESYLQQKKLKKALDQFHLALKNAASHYQMNVLNNLARTQLDLNQPDSAIFNARKSLDLSLQFKTTESQLKATEVLIDAHQTLGKYQSALAYYALHDSLSKVQFDEDKTKVINRLAFEYETERRKERIQLLEKEKSWQVEQVKIQKRNTILTLIGAVVLAIFSVSLVWILIKYRETNIALISQKQAAEKQSEALQLSNATKDRLFSIIGHDVLGPINRLKGVMKLVNQSVINKEEFSGMFPQLHQSVDHVQGTLENLLHWSSQQLRGQKVQPSVVQVRNIVQGVEALLSDLAKEKKIMLVNEVPSDLQLFIDENHLKIILRNLMTNALKFTEPKGVVSVRSKSGEDKVTIEVVDTGKGIAAEQMENIFKMENFQSTRGTAGEKGTGLGLILCKELTEANQGSISVMSNKVKGTTVSVSFPAFTS